MIILIDTKKHLTKHNTHSLFLKKQPKNRNRRKIPQLDTKHLPQIYKIKQKL